MQIQCKICVWSEARELKPFFFSCYWLGVGAAWWLMVVCALVAFRPRSPLKKHFISIVFSGKIKVKLKVEKILAGCFLCGVWMSPRCMRGFSPETPEPAVTENSVSIPFVLYSAVSLEPYLRHPHIKTSFGLKQKKIRIQDFCLRLFRTCINLLHTVKYYAWINL